MTDTLRKVLNEAPWLLDPDLEVCVAGSAALAEACRREGIADGPRVHDLDLAWRLDVEAGRRLCLDHGHEVGQTAGSEQRGTLAFRSASARIEITSFRGDAGDDGTPKSRIAGDAARRDMTIGALLWRLHDDSIHDPERGLDDWRAARIRACGGDAVARIREHPLRILRYLRRAAELGYVIDGPTLSAIRKECAAQAEHMLPEAVAEEVRKVLDLPSPGIFFGLAAEEGVLAHFMPEIAVLFDGRPAGRLRWHPELSQGLHTILTLAAAARIAQRDHCSEADRRRLILGVLCHDLGKGVTPEDTMPSHPGHEAAGASMVDGVFDRLPSLGDKRARRFCKTVARLHLSLASLRECRHGTLVEMWRRDLAPLREDFGLLAAAVRADREGRLAPEDLGWKQARPPFNAGAFERRVLRDIVELDTILREVRGDEVAREFAGQADKIQERLHELRCAALRRARYRRREAQDA